MCHHFLVSFDFLSRSSPCFSGLLLGLSKNRSLASPTEYLSHWPSLSAVLVLIYMQAVNRAASCAASCDRRMRVCVVVEEPHRLLRLGS